MKKVDIVIIGAGPSGLCCAISLANSGLSVMLIEKQPLDVICNPAFDGREIALTHTSKKILQELKIWQHFTATELFPLKDAKIFNGNYHNCVEINADSVGYAELGYIVSNNVIRKAAFQEFQHQCSTFELITEQSVNALKYDPTDDNYEVSLANQTSIKAKLVIAADSRFSETRRMVGIGARMHDFGKTMLVCQFNHTTPHNHIAREWFGYHQTLALLPLAENTVSVVLTLPHNIIQQLNQLNDEEFSAEISRRSEGILGKITLASSKHLYPLVGVYANEFASNNYALIGDAAVGMHPVTAHGFNFGLLSQQLLVKTIKTAQLQNISIGDKVLLKKYSKKLRQQTFPLYKTTNLIVNLFTNNSLIARFTREKLIKTANFITPMKKFIAAQLTKTV